MKEKRLQQGHLLLLEKEGPLQLELKIYTQYIEFHQEHVDDLYVEVLKINQKIHLLQ